MSHRDGSLVLREITLFLRGASDQIGMKPYILALFFFTLTLNTREKFISHRDGTLVLRVMFLLSCLSYP